MELARNQAFAFVKTIRSLPRKAGGAVGRHSQPTLDMADDTPPPMKSRFRYRQTAWNNGSLCGTSRLPKPRHGEAGHWFTKAVCLKAAPLDKQVLPHGQI